VAKTKGKARVANLPFSLSQYLDHHPFATLSVELGIEYPLPGPQVQPTLGDRQQRLIVDEEGFEVGVSVVLSGAVVAVIRAVGSQFLQPFPDILV
jgi:hypothetical protein